MINSGLRPFQPKIVVMAATVTFNHNRFPRLPCPHRQNLPCPHRQNLSFRQKVLQKPTTTIPISHFPRLRCSINNFNSNFKTCKNCKTQFDPSLNHPRACRFHTAHFGGETKRKFESVYTGGTLNTPDSGQVFQYWHCCGSEDPFDPGCTAAPHASYDD